MFPLILFLSSCGSVPSKEVAIGCQVADAGTTIYAKHIGAIEDNPIVSNNNILIFLKVGMIALIETQWENLNDFGRWAVEVISCGPVINNIAVIREQQRLNRESQQ